MDRERFPATWVRHNTNGTGVRKILRGRIVSDIRRIVSSLRLGHHGSHRLKSCGFLAAAILSALGAAAADPSSPSATSSDADLQRQIVKELAAGHDVKLLIQRARDSAAHVTAPLPPRSEDAAQLARELNNFHSALVSARSGALSPDSIRRLAVQYQQLLADHLLFEAHFDGINATLADANASSTVQGRAQAAHDTYAQTMAQLTSALDPTLGAVLSSSHQDTLLSETKIEDSGCLVDYFGTSTHTHISPCGLNLTADGTL